MSEETWTKFAANRNINICRFEAINNVERNTLLNEENTSIRKQEKKVSSVENGIEEENIINNNSVNKFIDKENIIEEDDIQEPVNNKEGAIQEVSVQEIITNKETVDGIDSVQELVITKENVVEEDSVQELIIIPDKESTKENVVEEDSVQELIIIPDKESTKENAEEMQKIKTSEESPIEEDYRKECINVDKETTNENDNGQDIGVEKENIVVNGMQEGVGNEKGAIEEDNVGEAVSNKISTVEGENTTHSENKCSEKIVTEEKDSSADDVDGELIIDVESVEEDVRNQCNKDVISNKENTKVPAVEEEIIFEGRTSNKNNNSVIERNNSNNEDTGNKTTTIIGNIENCVTDILRNTVMKLDEEIQKDVNKQTPTVSTPRRRGKQSKECNQTPGETTDEQIKPFQLGWSREVVERATSFNSKRMCDVYYRSPDGKKLRSTPDIACYLKSHSITNLTLNNFTFSKHSIYREPFEVLRKAKERSGNFKQKTPEKTKGPKTPTPAKRKEAPSTPKRDNHVKKPKVDNVRKDEPSIYKLKMGGSRANEQSITVQKLNADGDQKNERLVPIKKLNIVDIQKNEVSINKLKVDDIKKNETTKTMNVNNVRKNETTKTMNVNNVRKNETTKTMNVNNVRKNETPVRKTKIDNQNDGMVSKRLKKSNTDAEKSATYKSSITDYNPVFNSKSVNNTYGASSTRPRRYLRSAKLPTARSRKPPPTVIDLEKEDDDDNTESTNSDLIKNTCKLRFSRIIHQSEKNIKLATDFLQKYKSSQSNIPNSDVQLCSAHCPGCYGEVPSLQCSVCLCLFHPKCVGFVNQLPSSVFTCQKCGSEAAKAILQNMKLLQKNASNKKSDELVIDESDDDPNAISILSPEVVLQHEGSDPEDSVPSSNTLLCSFMSGSNVITASGEKGLGPPPPPPLRSKYAGIPNQLPPLKPMPPLRQAVPFTQTTASQLIGMPQVAATKQMQILDLEKKVTASSTFYPPRISENSQVRLITLPSNVRFSTQPMNIQSRPQLRMPTNTNVRPVPPPNVMPSRLFAPPTTIANNAQAGTLYLQRTSNPCIVLTGTNQNITRPITAHTNVLGPGTTSQVLGPFPANSLPKLMTIGNKLIYLSSPVPSENVRPVVSSSTVTLPPPPLKSVFTTPVISQTDQQLIKTTSESTTSHLVSLLTTPTLSSDQPVREQHNSQEHNTPTSLNKSVSELTSAILKSSLSEQFKSDITGIQNSVIPSTSIALLGNQSPFHSQEDSGGESKLQIENVHSVVNNATNDSLDLQIENVHSLTNTGSESSTLQIENVHSLTNSNSDMSSLQIENVHTVTSTNADEETDNNHLIITSVVSLNPAVTTSPSKLKTTTTPAITSPMTTSRVVADITSSCKPSEQIQSINKIDDHLKTKKRVSLESLETSYETKMTQTVIAVPVNSGFPPNIGKEFWGGDVYCWSQVKRNRRNQKSSSDLLTGMNSLMACFNCLNKVFLYLNTSDLLRARLVCKTWHRLASQPFLWEKISLKNIMITDWKQFAISIETLGTRCLDLRRMTYPGDLYSTWRKFVSFLNRFERLSEIEFGEVPTFVLYAVADNLIHLKSLKAECVQTGKQTHISVCVINLNLFESLVKLQCLQLRSPTGLSILNSSSGLAALQSFPKLRHLSITTLRDVESEQFKHLENLVNLETLEIGDCYNWELENYNILGKLNNLRKLRLEKGESYGGLIDALSNLVKLEELHLVCFKVHRMLGPGALLKLKNLRLLSIWPDTSVCASFVNQNTLNTISCLTNLQELEWVIFLENGDGKLENYAQRQAQVTDKNLLLPFEEENDSSEPNQKTVKSIKHISVADLKDRLHTLLPTTKVKFFEVPFFGVY